MSRRVYLSFQLEDLDLVRLFRGQALNANNNLEFSDHSVKDAFDSINADYIKGQIIEKLKQVSVNICLIGTTTYTSRWVDWEVRTSTRMGKGLLGVRLHSSSGDITPRAVTDAGARVVDWRIPEIVSGIETAAMRAGY